MTSAEKEQFIQEQCQQSGQGLDGRVLWSGHSVARLVRARVTRLSAERALIGCEVIEDYPEGHRPLPDCLVLGCMEERQPLHAVVALDIPNDRILIVTIYRPDPERWANEWHTRKR